MGEPAQSSSLKTTFKAILDELDKAALFVKAASLDIEVLIKIEDSPGIEATVYRAKKWSGTHLYVDYVSGPLLVTAPVIVALNWKDLVCFTPHFFK